MENLIGKFFTVGRNGLFTVIARKQRHLMVVFLLPSVKMGIWLYELNWLDHCIIKAQIMGWSPTWARQLFSLLPCQPSYKQELNWTSDPIDGMSVTTSYMIAKRRSPSPLCSSALSSWCLYLPKQLISTITNCFNVLVKFGPIPILEKLTILNGKSNSHFLKIVLFKLFICMFSISDFIIFITTFWAN